MKQEQADFFELLRGGDATSSTVAEPPQQERPTEETAEPELAADQTFDPEEKPGRLSPEARRALVSLLRHGVIMAADKRRLFDTLCRHRNPIQTHLADMYLRLVVDEQAGMALLLQQQVEDPDEEEISTLISRRPLSLYDTLLLLVLRKHYQEREAAGEQRVMIDVDRIENALRPFLPLTHSSRGDRRQLSGALKTMKERRILGSVRGEEDRFEITPVIRYVVSAAFLEQLLGEYRKLASDTPPKEPDDERP